jgi:alkanesulfonate monooxygenase SsuD/methylene tetrahydromethanopterin reductase-like flavin-dependent oxidoreductase (luciferase family)
MRPLAIGLFLSLFEGLGDDPTDWTPRWPDLLVRAQLAEAPGFDAIWQADHLLFQFPGEDRPRGAWDVWSMLTALAVSTRRLHVSFRQKRSNIFVAPPLP